MKKMIALTLCTMLTLSVCGCGSGSKNTESSVGAATDASSDTEEIILGNDPATWGPELDEETSDDSTAEDTTASVGMPNPFVEGTLEECEKLAGFAFTIPEHYGDYSERTILAIAGDLIEAIYTDQDPLEGLDDDALNKLDWETIDFNSDSLLIRKVLGTDTADVSGDYNTYAETGSLTIHDTEITTRGNDGTISNALWTDGTYTYAIVSSQGLTTSEFSELFAGIQ